MLRFSGKASGMCVASICRGIQVACLSVSSKLFVLGFFAEDGDDIFYGDNEESVVAFEVYGDGLLWVEEDAVVLSDWVVGVVFDLGGDRDDAACDCGDFDFVWEMDPGLGLFFVLVLADENAGADRFDGFDFGVLCFACSHVGL